MTPRQVATRIVALINNQSHTPTVAELEALLVPAMNYLPEIDFDALTALGVEIELPDFSAGFELPDFSAGLELPDFSAGFGAKG